MSSSPHVPPPAAPPLWRTFLAFLAPIVLSNLLQSLSGTINGIWIGQLLGTHALAAVSGMFPVVFFFIALVVGLGAGASVLGFQSQEFLDAWGSVTGSVFPTGRRIDVIDGVAVTCIDAAMPLMIIRAQDLGLSGRESPTEIDANRALLERIESLRRIAGERMGLGDVSTSVIPKPVLVSPGDDDDSLTSRYFTPRRCHASHAVTGAIGVATAFALPGTVALTARSATTRPRDVAAREERHHRERRDGRGRAAALLGEAYAARDGTAGDGGSDRAKAEEAYRRALSLDASFRPARDALNTTP